MNAWSVLAAGIAPDHAVALVAGLVATAVVAVLGEVGVLPRVALAERVTVLALVFTAALHLALPLGHHDGAVLALAFVGSGVAYALLALRVVQGRPWRRLATVLVVATLVAYLAVVGSGGEGPDQVGLLTALDELLVLAVATAPRPSAPVAVPVRRPFPARALAAARTAGLTASVLLVGASAWAAAWAPHGHESADVVALGGHGSVAAHGGDADGGHDHGGQAQAGMIEWVPPVEPTPVQRAAAERLVARTAGSLARYRDIRAALAAGYRATLTRRGVGVHLALPGATGTEPDRPPMLMYAVEDGRATLLSAVYTAPVSGPPDEAAALPWHTHNGCVSLLPPGLGITSPFGDCPWPSVAGTLPLMAHVWVVDPPDGPLAEHVDEAWIRGYAATHGVAFTW